MRGHCRWMVWAVLAATSLLQPAHAQFVMVPTPVLPESVTSSQAESPEAYRRDAARHLYRAYPLRIYKGRMPAYLYGIVVTETDISEDGEVLAVRIKREPAAVEVGPWVMGLIQKAGPFPRPVRLGATTYTDLWLVDREGQFQLDALTEGQLKPH